MAGATLYNKGCPCSCDRRIEDNCTACCPIYLGSDQFFETHSEGECPNVGEPCPSGPNPESPSCANRTIGPKTLRSETFPTGCLKKLKPVAAVSLYADNFGSVTGKSGKVGCPPSNACVTCSTAGTLTPSVESVGGGKSRLKITARAQNSQHGGPYTLSVTVFFGLEPK